MSFPEWPLPTPFCTWLAGLSWAPLATCVKGPLFVSVWRVCAEPFPLLLLLGFCPCQAPASLDPAPPALLGGPSSCCSF